MDVLQAVGNSPRDRTMQSIKNAHSCICNSSKSLTIEIDKEVADTFSRGWTKLGKFKEFELIFNKSYRKDKPESGAFLNVLDSFGNNCTEESIVNDTNAHQFGNLKYPQTVSNTVQTRPSVIVLRNGNISKTPNVLESQLRTENVNFEIDFDFVENECNNNLLTNITLENLNNFQEKRVEVAPIQLPNTKLKSTPRKLAKDLMNYEILNNYIKIGPGQTVMPKNIYDSINWSLVRAATRKLLITLFSREILATHTLTGKPSPAFLDQNKPSKKQLDPRIVEDIIHLIMTKCNVDARTVRSIITLKCADENKMFRMRNRKHL